MNKSKVSYFGEKIFVGIDVHRKFFVVCVVLGGEVVKRCRVPGNGFSLVEFLRKNFEGTDISSCYESGFSGFWLHRYLEEHGIKNIVVHAASIEVEAGNRVKTDKRDSKKMAEQLYGGRLRGIRIPSEAQEQRRLLTRTREQLIRARTRVRNQIRSKLYQFGLYNPPTNEVLTRRVVKGLLCRGVTVDLDVVLRRHLSVWENLQEEIRAVEKELLKQASNDPLEETYRSVPGFGPLAARIVSNELGDMSQFPNERALFSFTGLTPGEHSSGERVCRGHISRQGSSRLRHILVEVAWHAVRKDKELRESFERIAARRGKKIAIVAIARKLIGRARAVVRTQMAQGLKQAA